MIIILFIIIMQQDNILEKPDSHTLDRQGEEKDYYYMIIYKSLKPINYLKQKKQVVYNNNMSLNPLLTILCQRNEFQI